MVRTRFAPSPTGYLHIGSLRTALFAYLFAKNSGGEFVLRIEDTDRTRYVPESVDQIIKTLEWAGLFYDDGPYIQSERLPIYQEHAQKLVDLGFAYYAFDTPEELSAMREQQEKEKQPPRYDRMNMRNQLTIAEGEFNDLINSNTSRVIRFKVPEDRVIKFNDLVRGEVSFNTKELDDQIILKSDGFPTYHLAVVVDDHLMDITHVIRGEEWLPSTPKHILLYEAFDWEAPEYAHLSLLVNDKKQKLSKREGDVSVEDFIQKGYLSKAIVNFIVFLGWNPGDEREFFTLPELAAEFSFERIHKSPAVFDIDKLNYFNSHYIREMAVLDLLEAIKPFSKYKFDVVGQEKMIKIVSVVKDRLVVLSDFDDLARVFFELPQYETSLIQFAKSTKEHTLMGLQKALDLLKDSETNWDDQDILTDVLGSAVHELGLKNGDVFWPVRVALSGQEKSPSPVELLWVLGREESISRMQKALDRISGI